MDGLIAWIAQYLLWVMVAGFAAVWLFVEHGRGKLQLGLRAVLGLGLALAFLYIAQSVHHDPRPFMVNPHVKPLFPHAPDNGFPSDHSIAAGLIATLVVIRHRLVGLLFAAAAAAIAWARVAAHVHHLQDVVAGLLLGALAAAIASMLAAPLLTRAARHDRTGRTNRTGRLEEAEGGGALDRREDPDPGAGPDRAVPADAPRSAGEGDARLRAPRHHGAVRGAGDRHREDH